MRSSRLAAGAASPTLPGPGAAPVSPPQRPAEVPRPAQRTRLGDLGAGQIAVQGWPHLVIAVDDERHRRRRGAARCVGPRHRLAAAEDHPPGRPERRRAVLQPGIADLCDGVALLEGGDVHRAAHPQALAVNVADLHGPLHRPSATSGASSQACSGARDGTPRNPRQAPVTASRSDTESNDRQ